MIPYELLIDTVAKARLERLHPTDRGLRHPAPSWAGPPPAGTRPWEARPLTTSPSSSFRSRVGGWLLALGAAIADEDASSLEAPGAGAPDTEAPCTEGPCLEAPGHAQRAA